MHLEQELQNELRTLIADWIKTRKPSVASVTLITCIHVENQTKVGDPEQSILDKPFGVLRLSARAYNALNNGGGCCRPGDIQTIGDIVRRGVEQLLKFRNMGYKSILEIRAALIAEGVKLDHTWRLPKSYNGGWEPAY